MDHLLHDADDRRRARLERARLYLVCDGRPGDSDPERFLDAVLDAGVDIVQLRDKRRDDGELLAAAAIFRRACDEAGALFILNDRPDLVGRCGADGVHLGQDDMPVPEARRLVGPERLIGLSTHTSAQVDAATGIDYVGVGPVHVTPTKPGRPAVGIELVRHAAEHARVPFFAIGGIGPDNVDGVIEAGARRLAVVRAVCDAADPAAAARALISRIDAAPAVREARVGST